MLDPDLSRRANAGRLAWLRCMLFGHVDLSRRSMRVGGAGTRGWMLTAEVCRRCGEIVTTERPRSPWWRRVLG